MNKYSSFTYFKDFVSEQVTQVSKKGSTVQLSLQIYYGKNLNLKNSINEEIESLIAELPYDKKIIDLNFLEVVCDIPFEENLLFFSQKGKLDSLHGSSVFLDFERNVSDVQEKIIEVIENQLAKKLKLLD